MLRICCILISYAALAAAELPAGLFVASPPDGAVEVIAARAQPQPGERLVVRGVVGGRAKPFVDGRAVFTLMDRSLVCDTACGTGWSGCGTPPEALRTGIATVQISDADGRPLMATLSGQHGLVPGASVVIRGTVSAGSNERMLVIAAEAIHVANGGG